MLSHDCVEFHVVTIDGKQAGHSVFGEGKEHVVLLPGGPGMSAVTMVAEAEMLSSSMICHLIDPPGSGLSSGPTSSNGYTPKAHAVWYAEVCSKLAITSYHVLGASFGGLVALEMAAIFPERVRSIVDISTRVKGAEISYSEAELQAEEAALQRHSMSSWYPHARRVFDNWTEAVLAATTDEEVTAMNEIIVPLYLAYPDRADVKARLQRQADMAKVNLEAMKAWESGLFQKVDIRDILPHVKCRCLFLCGEYDWMAGPLHANYAASLVNGARWLALPDCGHIPSVESPRELRRVLRDWYKI